MQFLIDHLIAVVVGSVVVLALSALVLNAADGTRGRLGTDLNRSALGDAVELVEQDMRNAGDGGGIVSHSAARPAPGGRETALDFWTVPEPEDPAAPAPGPARVRYEVVGLDSVDVVRDGHPARVAAYALERYVLDASGLYAPAGTIDQLSEVTVSLVDAAGAPTAALADVRGIGVRLGRLASWSGDDASESRWEAVFWPPNLAL